mmetsp:Transcript_80660/g.231630  ORF Transcript_80660/g.231630 Transcript_80660/m.231630 type:complete len:462 (+) Transcript_80660:70-1455(+)
MPLGITLRATRVALAAAASSALLLLPSASAEQREFLVHEEAAPALTSDDECSAEGGEGCALNALQLRAHKKNEAEHESLLQMTGSELEARRDFEAENRTGIWHYALPCYYSCNKKPGFCENYCGPMNACCKYEISGDPPECHGVRFWPVLSFYTCVSTGIQESTPDANKVPTGGGTSGPQELIYANSPDLLKPSDAPVLTFYMYRSQSSENYDPENQNMASLAGVLWYLHNEIVWHPNLQRSGTNFATPKTRIEKFKVSTKATQPLWDLGMNFGVVNAFDLTKCTGPYDCTNFKEYGYPVGCENWLGGEASFPHGQWVDQNMYPGATWYSLPGPCSSKGFGEKTEACMMSEPGGACRNQTVPTGAGDCTYVYEKVGEISIDELEGINSQGAFVAMGYQEYNKDTDKGYGTDFWNGKMSMTANQNRIDAASALFKKHYPDQEDLADPPCDFNKNKFYAYASR